VTLNQSEKSRSTYSCWTCKCKCRSGGKAVVVGQTTTGIFEEQTNVPNIFQFLKACTVRYNYNRILSDLNSFHFGHITM